MERHKNGRFAKDDGWHNISINLPSFKSITLWSLLFIIILPWLYILSKLNILEKINSIFERLFSFSSDEKDSKKKWIILLRFKFKYITFKLNYY